MYRLVHVQSQTHENTNIDPKKQSKSVLLYTFCWFNDNYVWYSGIPMVLCCIPRTLPLDQSWMQTLLVQGTTPFVQLRELGSASPKKIEKSHPTEMFFSENGVYSQ